MDTIHNQSRMYMMFSLAFSFGSMILLIYHIVAQPDGSVLGALLMVFTAFLLQIMGLCYQEPDVNHNLV